MAEEFPDRQWGSRTTLLARAANRFAATRPGSRFIRIISPLDRAILDRTDAKYTVLGPIGAPVILLTTIGRTSGQPRTHPLLYVHGGDTLYVIGSNFGQDHHPAWTANLLANPIATVVISGERINVLATPVTGPDKDTVFTQFVDLAGAYAAYRSRTTRDLRIFALHRA
ncbi:nitroreductase/quinone reductase family protein [Nocardia sp. NPDC049190]|uniref:nitroreductase/quinone reductase family protein n=1 Tax=Nocardia sp. NPDC049190 TaxID=3155650 RepID=UPI0033CA7827